jgi:tetratricopeptide (TPR) repeat protein
MRRIARNGPGQGTALRDTGGSGLPEPARARAGTNASGTDLSGVIEPGAGTSASLRTRAACLIAIFCAVALLTARHSSAQDFYEEQLRAGRDSFQAGRNPEAADELRIAAFGLLDRPLLLVEALVRLAVVQNNLGNAAGLTHTLERFLDVEGRLPVYAKLPIDSSIRLPFETILLKNVPRAAISSVPSLLGLLDSEQQKIARLPRPERLKAFEAGATREPKNAGWSISLAREYAASGDSASVIQWAGHALELDKGSSEALTLLAHARAGRGECRAALTLLDRLGASDLQQRPELLGDQVVCLVEQKRWSEAQAALTRLPDSVKSRDDVKRATQAVKDQETPRRPARSGSVAASGEPEATASPAVVARTGVESEARPNSGSPEPVEASRDAGPPRSVAPTRASGSPAPRPERTSSSANEAVRRQSAHSLEQARQLVSEGKYQNATRVLVGAVQDDSSNRVLRRALLESSVLAADWRTAAAQAALVSPFLTGEELSMFYASVALFETGKKDEAKRLMERAQPHMAPSPFADYYMRVILSQ